MPKYANELPHRRCTLCSGSSFVWTIETGKLEAVFVWRIDFFLILKNFDQMQDNLSYMKDYKPLNEKERTYEYIGEKSDETE
jgi:hypothetical protein